MRILVTGGAGFIGSNFIKWALKNKPDVELWNLDALTYAGNLENLKSEMKSHKFIKGSITDGALIRELIPQVDAVINFAAESHVDRSIDGPRIFVLTNVLGTQEILEAVRTLKPKLRYVQVSTDEVYGSLGPTGAFTEATPLAPNSPYSSSKAAADLLVRAYHHTYGLDVVTTRCSNNYGRFQFPEKLIPLMIKNALEDKALPIYGDGLNVRDWIYVDDHCEGVWMAYEKAAPGTTYNFGGRTEFPNIEIVKLVLKELGKPESLISFVKDRPGHDRRYAMDCALANRDLGWRPRTNFADGLKQTIRWYLENQDWVKNVSSGDYQEFYSRWYRC